VLNEDGTWKKGAKARNRSKRYQKRAATRKERQRRLKAERRRGHDENKNRIRDGTIVRTEANSYKGWPRSPFRQTL
jgi:hypothetical protein